MDPATIAIIFQALDLAIKLAPEIRELVHEIKLAIGKNPDVIPSLEKITSGTIEVSDATLAALAPLLKGSK